MKSINIGLVGLGTVGKGVVEIFRRHREDFAKHYGVEMNIVLIASRSRQKAVNLGVEDIFTTDLNAVIEADNIDIVIELIGGTGVAKDVILRSLKAGKHVVTANKAVMASAGEEVFAAAEEGGVSILFGASVGGGIPIIGPLKHSLTANQISSIMGIVNGTTNYMLTRMGEDGMDYSDALREAQRKGFAEANPTADVDGFDAAAKIAILASIAFNCRISMDDVHTEGITKISPLDLQFANEMGYSIKLLAIANLRDESVEVRVHPAMLPHDHQLANVNGVYNAIYVVGDFVGATMFFGEGAGEGPAASAVVADVIETARAIADGVSVFHGCSCTEERPILPMESISAEYYIRIPVLDRPGVFAEIARIFAAREISIKSAVQRGGDGRTTDLVIITHRADEGPIQSAVLGLMDTEVIVSEPQLIRLVR